MDKGAWVTVAVEKIDYMGYCLSRYVGAYRNTKLTSFRAIRRGPPMRQFGGRLPVGVM